MFKGANGILKGFGFFDTSKFSLFAMKVAEIAFYPTIVVPRIGQHFHSQNPSNSCHVFTLRSLITKPRVTKVSWPEQQLHNSLLLVWTCLDQKQLRIQLQIHLFHRLIRWRQCASPRKLFRCHQRRSTDSSCFVGLEPGSGKWTWIATLWLLNKQSSTFIRDYDQ